MHQQATSKQTTTDALYCFDDIELYTRVYWRGRPGWVLDKGYHVSGGDKNARHLLVQYDSSYTNENREARVHENIVNKYLAEEKRLWIDFNEHLSGGQ